MWYGHIPVLSSPVTATFYFQFVNTTGSAADPTSPTYRVYEDATGSVMAGLSGSLTKLDTGLPLAGLYYVQIAISSANGFEDGKYYVVRGSGTVDGETPAGIHSFRCGPEPANLKQIDEGATNGNNATLFLKKLDVVNSTGDAIRASSTGSNGRGMLIDGNGSGAAILATGGATAPAALLTGAAGAGGIARLGATTHGVDFQGLLGGDGMHSLGSSGGHGFNSIGGNSNGVGIRGEAGAGNAEGILAQAKGTSPGGRFRGGAASGPGITFEALGVGNAIEAITVGATPPLSQNIADQLIDGNWDEPIGDHLDPGSTGFVLSSLFPLTLNAIAASVWSQDLLGFNTTGTAGLRLKSADKVLRNRLKITAPGTLTIYDDNGVDPLYVWDLLDSTSTPTTSEPFERLPA